MDLDFEPFECSFNEDVFQAIEHQAHVYAKMTVEKMLAYKKLNTYETQISYVDPQEDEDDDSSDFIDFPEDNKCTNNHGALGDDNAASIIEDNSLNEAPEDASSNTFQDAADVQNEDMSMVQFNHNDIYLFSAATTTCGSEDQLFQIPDSIQEVKEEHQESDDEIQVTDYARDNLFSVDKMFENVLASDSEPEDENIIPNIIDKDNAAVNFDPLGREPLPEDCEMKEKFKLKLFTIYEETEEEKQFTREILEAAGPLKTYAPIDEMARVGILFSDDECEDDTLKSFPNISIESSNFEGYKSGTIDLSKLASSPFMSTPNPETSWPCRPQKFIESCQPVDVPETCSDLSKREIKPLRRSKKASPLSGFKFDFNYPTPAVPTTAITFDQPIIPETPVAHTTTPAAVEPAVGKKDATVTELILSVADNTVNHSSSLVLANDQGGDNDRTTHTRAHYHEDVWDFYLAEQSCFVPSIPDDAKPGIIDYGFIGTVPACFQLPTVYDRVIEEVIETAPEPEPLTIQEHPPIVTGTNIEAVALPADDEATALQLVLNALSNLASNENPGDSEEFAAAIDAALLVDMGSLHSIDIDNSEPLTEQSINNDACNSASEIVTPENESQTAIQQPPTAQDELLYHLSLPEVSMTHEESMMEA
ncbi:hypothetical protein SCUCBS95973_003951 [Sporothrix curviconia]|uniref:Uncharacterized protein n=1 Tax=Sporothrix curviconia TaxID=1260050 RepID=A0ABP0BJK8_9PEZI